MNKARDTFHTLPLAEVQANEDGRHREHIAQVLENVQTMFSAKGGDYNNMTTFIENMPFGDFSWATLLWIKAHRLGSVLKKGDKATFDGISEIVLDLIVYAVCYLAWRGMIDEDSQTS